MQLHNHQLEGIHYLSSPNFDSRPEKEISLIVIHAISLPVGNYDTELVCDLFTNQLDIKKDPSFSGLSELKVSSHLLITRTGQLIQFVPFNLRAWHAGVSNYNGRENCNDFSIGIELEGCDFDKFTEEQYSRLNECLQLLIHEYSIPRFNIVGHSDIAPGRKTDPGPYFDWNKISV